MDREQHDKAVADRLAVVEEAQEAATSGEAPKAATVRYPLKPSQRRAMMAARPMKVRFTAALSSASASSVAERRRKRKAKKGAK